MNTQPDNIYFFGTCLIDLFYPKAGLAGMQLIKRTGVNVIYPDKQGCCGQPAFNSGYRQQALAVARSLLRCFPRDIPLVVPSGSCAGMIKHHWPELFKNQPEETSVIKLAQRTYELTEFLVEVLHIKLQDLGKPVKVAVHTSCSARREMKVADHIETLINQLSNVEKLQHHNKEECCGFGGTFAIKQPEISGAMVEDKTRYLKDSGAELVISQDCGCLMNIGGAFKKQGSGPVTQHIAEFLWERSNASE
jgi:L-lactate dehydrogenase complex protein LldE